MSNLQSMTRGEQVRESSHGIHFTITPTPPVESPSEVIDEADQLWILYKQNPTDQLRNRLIERYMPIVRSRAERIWARLPDGIELDDLISAGNFGLMDAISVFDPSRGIRFEAFCLPRIQGSIVDELRKMDWVPRVVRSKATKLNDAYKNLQIEHGRKPTDQEVADYLNVSVEELQQLYAETHNVNISSLDKSWGDSDGSKEMREIDVVPDKRSEDPTERLAKIDVIRNFTKGLTKTERMIVILYYYEEFTMREIGAALELSESRVSQMHSAIVDRIKKVYKSQL
ncbi:MAG: FliA/WhiG family RNA polymerase sigma factor [Planctomycetaceae bacterium]|jgi:RNA polymerase sigma factor for flagellar operon FliA|nr:FliA/WhiG family RNA polymerase sigma factor [Planctomycetaceae bacterium]